MLNSQLHKVDLNDLMGLISNGVPEGAQLEYKEALPGNDDESKKEFLRDVSAMANTAGGDIIYGVREERPGDDAPAAEIVAITGEDIDSRKLWMENLIRDGIEPRLTGVGIHVVPADGAGSVFIVRVPRSWNGPHVVNFRKHWRFYARNSAGNYQMNVSQVREAFVLRESLGDKLEAFRNERIKRIKDDPALGQGAKLVLHLQPFDSTRPDAHIDVWAATGDYRNLVLGGLESRSSETRLNFDGLISYYQSKDRTDYVQIFRSGATEEVDADMSRKGEDDKIYINSLDFERTFIRAAGRRLALLKTLGVTSPVMLYLSLLGVKGCRIKLDTSRQRRAYFSLQEETEQYPIDRDDLLVGGILIENIQEEKLEGTASKELGENKYVTAARIVRSAIDAVWNAAGCHGSLHYNSDGDWTGGIEAR